jgi:hypothetical protein
VVTANQGAANATPWNENLSQYGGSAVGAANAAHVQPGTGAVFPTTLSAAVPAGTNLIGAVTPQAADGTAMTRPVDSGRYAEAVSDRDVKRLLEHVVDQLDDVVTAILHLREPPGMNPHIWRFKRYGKPPERHTS